MLRYIILMLGLAPLLFAQVEHSRSESAYTYFPGFDMDVANYPTGNPEVTRVDVFIKMPYANLQFVRSDEGYTAKYSVTLTFYDEEKENIILERIWNEKISTNDFSQAVSKKNFNYSYRSFDIQPEHYVIRCETVDKDSRQNYVVEAKTNVARFEKPIEISDIVFISEKTQTPNGPKIIPSVSNRVTNNDLSIPFFFEIYSDKAQTVSVEYALLNNKEELVAKEVNDLTLRKGTNVFEHELDSIQFTLGEYSLTIRVRDEEWEVIDGTNKKFNSHIYGYPDSIIDLDKAVEQMSYIANNTVIDNIEEAPTYEEKLDRFKEYWKSKDPSPNTDENEVLNEYYRRIDYANENFEHYFEGWKTDMGMIYIILGPPSNVERHPFEYNSKPYEVWDYYDINKRFVFVDQTGFGDYRLLDQQYGDWYRYRQ